MATTVDINTLGLTLAGTSILSDITLNLSEKRIAVIGRNGSGKSTLAKLLCGLITPTVGTINITSSRSTSPCAPNFRDIGLIFQNPDQQIIFPTVSEEIGFGLKQLSHNDEQIKEITQKTLAHFGKQDWLELPVSHLSQGQRHLLCLMSVFAMEPSIVVLDEPYSGLDIPTTRILENYLDKLNQMIVHITHDISTLNQYERVIWVENGKVAQDGPPNIVLPLFISAMNDLGDL